MGREIFEGMAMADYMKMNRETYLQNYVPFAQVFHRPLKDFWNPTWGFDVIAFDEKFIKPDEGESTNEAVRRKYGNEAVTLVNSLFRSTKR